MDQRWRVQVVFQSSLVEQNETMLDFNDAKIWLNFFM